MSISAFQIPVFPASTTRVLQTSARDWGLAWPLPQRASAHRSLADVPLTRVRHRRARRALRFAFAI
ncbi:hypothetical protein [Hylemonella gracilis]|uniref:Uncharacterized protein n=1 Tax=Hylemonella gracilis ATCC 19624 TaxID=887062 RepID=F3KR37_9BURK|nr:hypothetical protein [Hylemonella gracilis]EGI77738.1 hypothetical protein HGR_04563 [Hylemonella gracilis ATCC 19624]